MLKQIRMFGLFGFYLIWAIWSALFGIPFRPVSAQASAFVHLEDGEVVTIECLTPGGAVEGQLVTLHIRYDKTQLKCFRGAPIMTPTMTATVTPTATLATPRAVTLTPTAETPVLFPSPTLTFTATPAPAPTAFATLSASEIRTLQECQPC